jgi:hypothetical protein
MLQKNHPIHEKFLYTPNFSVTYCLDFQNASSKEETRQQLRENPKMIFDSVSNTLPLTTEDYEKKTLILAILTTPCCCIKAPVNITGEEFLEILDYLFNYLYHPQRQAAAAALHSDGSIQRKNEGESWSFQTEDEFLSSPLYKAGKLNILDMFEHIKGFREKAAQKYYGQVMKTNFTNQFYMESKSHFANLFKEHAGEAWEMDLHFYTNYRLIALMNPKEFIYFMGATFKTYNHNWNVKHETHIKVYFMLRLWEEKQRQASLEQLEDGLLEIQLGVILLLIRHKYKFNTHKPAAADGSSFDDLVVSLNFANKNEIDFFDILVLCALHIDRKRRCPSFNHELHSIEKIHYFDRIFYYIYNVDYIEHIIHDNNPRNINDQNTERQVLQYLNFLITFIQSIALFNFPKDRMFVYNLFQKLSDEERAFTYKLGGFDDSGRPVLSLEEISLKTKRLIHIRATPKDRPVTRTDQNKVIAALNELTDFFFGQMLYCLAKLEDFQKKTIHDPERDAIQLKIKNAQIEHEKLVIKFLEEDKRRKMEKQKETSALHPSPSYSPPPSPQQPQQDMVEPWIRSTFPLSKSLNAEIKKEEEFYEQLKREENETDKIGELIHEFQLPPKQSSERSEQLPAKVNQVQKLSKEEQKAARKAHRNEIKLQRRDPKPS